MLTYVDDSIFSSPARVLVNTVNTVGVMGKGLALEFKRLFPDMFRAYQRLCESGDFEIGTLQLYRTLNKEILNFPTKKHWRSPSRVEYIERGLAAFVLLFREWGISSVSFPQLGCGNGELDWETQVRPIMEKHLSDLPIDVYIHIYPRSGSLPEHRMTEEIRTWLRGQPRSLGVFEVWEDLFQRPAPVQSEDPELVAWNETSSAEDFYMLRWIWDRLRSFGFVSMLDVLEKFGEESKRIMDALLDLPYVEESCFVAAKSPTNKSVAKTLDMLARPEARGLRLVSERIPAIELTREQMRPLW